MAAVVTEFTYRSHAHVILENFLEPYYFNGRLTDPGVDVVSLYVDQVPEGRDMSREVAKKYRLATYPTIARMVTSSATPGYMLIQYFPESRYS